MASPQEHREERSESPDPSSHTRNTYDAATVESECDETEDDDLDYEPPDEESEELEFFESTEDADGDFQGTSISQWTFWDGPSAMEKRMLSCHRCR